MPPESPKLDALSRILEQERDSGFRDETVIGGLDLFLQRWRVELKPALGDLGSYSVMTSLQRESWAQDALSKLGEATGPQSPAGVSTARRRKPSGARKGRAALTLGDDVTRLKGFPTRYLKGFKRIGLMTVGDLVYHFPNRHNDYAHIRKIADLEHGEEQTVVVTVWEASETRQGPRRRSTQAVLGDDTGNVRAIWFNQPYLTQTFRPGTPLVISGKVNVFRGSFVFESPEYELLKDQEELVHTGRMVPVYPTVDGLPQRTLRRMVKQALDVGLSSVVEFLAQDTRHRLSLVGLQNAVAQIHYPDTSKEWAAARRRLAFDELLPLQLAALSRKRAWQEEDAGVALKADPQVLDAFLAALPFQLTGAQSRVLSEVLRDMDRSRPMSRLVQGDVGSGKTVVAFAALLVAAFEGYQGAFMAPTEILAEQHFLTVRRLLTGDSTGGQEEHLASVAVGSMPRPITIGLLMGSLSRKAKEDLHQRVAEREVDILIGTHALIQQEVEIPDLAVAVVDEQQRFGVMQRATIRGKGLRPHLLAMSATPIPRSLSLTLYGDLDISVIDELPPGRQRIRTKRVEPEGRATAYNFVRKQVEEGRQAFIVCPLIEESEAIQTRAAVVEYERLSREVFADLRLGLLHGRMALREKEQVMERFQRAELDILVSTPVVEVGIDVANATVMLVDGADRFGLAQLHQFRGRVGRGKHQSYCLLLADSPGKEALERLKIVERVQDGFELSEEDLRLRGPGDYMGTRQSGLPELMVARITDHDILALAREEATKILDSDPGLVEPGHTLLAKRVAEIAAGLSGEMS